MRVYHGVNAGSTPGPTGLDDELRGEQPSEKRPRVESAQDHDFLPRDEHGARGTTAWLTNVAARRVLDFDGRLLARRGKMRGKMSRVDEQVGRTGRAPWKRNNDVCSCEVPRMKPKVMRLGHTDGQLVVVERSPADEYASSGTPNEDTVRRSGAVRLTRAVIGRLWEGLASRLAEPPSVPARR